MKTPKTVNYNGESYDYFTTRCVDSDGADSYEIAVDLDLGNGRPETIGYLPFDASEADVRGLVIEELERLSS
jgi:hypothetical protein